MSAANSLKTQNIHSFGEFTLNTAERTLQRSGQPLSIAPKALEVLIVLVENRGRIVEKDDLMKKVWPGTFVEENNLAFNVSVLRRLFGESGESPNFIETVPKRGYRFIGEVVPISSGQPAPAAAAMDPMPDPMPGTTTGSRPNGLTRPRVLLVALVAVTVAGVFAYSNRRPRHLTDKDTIVLADFVNKTGDPVFDETLRQGLAIQLEQSPFLGLVPDQRIQQTLRLMRQPAEARLTSGLAREVCERLGSTAVVEGAIAPLGSRYVLSLTATNCGSGGMIDRELEQAAGKEEILKALTLVAAQLRKQIGESAASIEKHATPLEEATTPSLEALRAYSMALKVWSYKGPGVALPLLQQAIEIDPGFAVAHAALGQMHGELFEPDLAAKSAEIAYQLRDRVSYPERFSIMVPYEWNLKGNLENARRTAEEWAEMYPRDPRPRGYLSAFDQWLGKYEESVEDGRKAVVLGPDFPPSWNNLAWAYVLMNKLPEAEDTLRRASERKIEFPEFLIMRYYIAFLKKDQAGMERAAILAKENSDVADWAWHEESVILAHSGQLEDARARSRQAIRLAGEDSHKRDHAGMYEAEAAVREAFFGNTREARLLANAALKLSDARDVKWGAAFAFALSGDFSRSNALARDLQERFNDDTAVRFTYLPVLGALAALKNGDSSKALELLQTAAPFDLAVPGSWSGFYGNLYPVYVRGQAYLAAHRDAEAAAEFQKILDKPGTVFADPVGPVARLQLGKALLASGEKGKAKAAFQDLLTLWDRADADMPILKQVRAEFNGIP